MPNIDRIIILAQSGVTVRQAEATLGRKMLRCVLFGGAS